MLRTIFGHIHDNSNIIIVDKNNDILFVDNENKILEFVLSYESSSSNLVYFSLKVKDDSRYINIDKNNNAIISPIKRVFWLDHSSVDNFPRSKILSNTKYNIKTLQDNIDHIIFTEVMFVPITWYENINNLCMIKSGIDKLLEDGIGYTTKQWCDLVPNAKYCEEGEQCGNCIGKCDDPTLICYLNDYKFVCGNPLFEPLLDGSTIIPPQVTGTGPTVIAVILIIIIIALLIWTFNRRS